MKDDVAPRAGEGVERRELIKRAAIAGGVVAWTAPTIQVLGASTAWGGEDKEDKKGDKGSGKPCSTKPTIVTYTWAGGTCAQFPDPCASNCGCTDGAGNCASGDVFITTTDGATMTSVSGSGAVLDGPTQVHGPVGFSFTTAVTGNNQIFVVRTGSHTGPTCQTVQFHVSCSQPAIVLGVQIGGLVLSAWNAS